jgi:hypothetical protein
MLPARSVLARFINILLIWIDFVEFDVLHISEIDHKNCDIPAIEICQFHLHGTRFQPTNRPVVDLKEVNVRLSITLNTARSLHLKTRCTGRFTKSARTWGR